MAPTGDANEAMVTEDGTVRIPASVRDRLGIHPGDRLRWEIDENGTLSVVVCEQRYGAFDDFEPVSMDGDGLDGHDLAGNEDDPAFGSDR